MNLKKIIEEEIFKLINEESEGERKIKKSQETARYAKVRDGREVSSGDKDRIENMIDTNVFNVSKLAQKIYPDHTKEGAQSQLRKAIKGDIPLTQRAANGVVNQINQAIK